MYSRELRGGNMKHQHMSRNAKTKIYKTRISHAIETRAKIRMLEVKILSIISGHTTTNNAGTRYSEMAPKMEKNVA